MAKEAGRNPDDLRLVVRANIDLRGDAGGCRRGGDQRQDGDGDKMLHAAIMR
jgi:hypothetical protein